MPLSTFSNLTLISNGTPVDVNNVINPDLTLINNNFTSLYSYSQRSIGGGWTSSELADSSVLSRNYKPQRGVFYSGVANGSAITNNFLIVNTFSVNTSFANADVEIEAQQVIEPNNNAGTYMFKKVIERSTSPTFTSSTIVMLSYDTKYYAINGIHTAWTTLSDKLIDTISVPGTYYYRYGIGLERYNNGFISGTYAQTVSAGVKANYMKYEITNGSVL